MCLITVKPKDVALPQEEHLRNGEENNQDGIGCCYWKKDTNEIVIKKDFQDIEEFLDWMRKNIKKEDALIIHFRYATSGLKDAGNRHPFPITKNWKLLRETNTICQFAFAHNGVISEYSKGDKYSDTQKFVVDILADDGVKNNLDSIAIQKLISGFVGQDRLAIMTSDGNIRTWGEWHEEGNIHFSNTGYKWRINRVERTGFSNWRNDKELVYDAKTGTYKKKTTIEHFPAKHKDNKLECKGKAFFNHCDGCSDDKGFDRWVVEVIGRDGFTYYLCKKCRKRYKKGFLILWRGERMYDEGQLDEKSITKALATTDAPQLEGSKNPPQVQEKCAGCSKWYNIDELTKPFGMDNGGRLCDDCLIAYRKAH